MNFGDNPLPTKLGGLAVATYVRCWMNTMDCQAVYYDRSVDPVQAAFRGPVIYLTWHEYLMVPYYLRGGTNAAILTSRHRDADWLSESARHMGFLTVRGSTSRGGSAAMLELLRRIGKVNLGMTPDGPRGPRRRMERGPIYLSSKLGVPLIPLAVGCDRPWRLPTWDRFAVPRPFSRIRLIFGPRVQIPPQVDRASVEHFRVQVERLLNSLTLEAEAWAGAGTRKVDQSAVQRQPQPGSLRRVDHAPPERRPHRCRVRAGAEVRAGSRSGSCDEAAVHGGDVRSAAPQGVRHIFRPRDRWTAPSDLSVEK